MKSVFNALVASSFLFVSAVQANDARYPEFDRPLGEPQGEMARDGWKLSREYKHASVWVDLESKEAEIS